MCDSTQIDMPKEIRRNGLIATLTKARKEFICRQSGLLINKDEFYYVVISGGSGLAGIKHPDRVKAGFINAHLNKKTKED